MLSGFRNLSQVHWKRINMRRVEHLPAVELIHDLYSQHAFKINTFRFRNTITIWKDDVVNSYAPEDEWCDFEDYLGEKFFNLDELLLQELESLYSSDRTFIDDYLSTVDISNLSDLSNYEIQNILINIQGFTLGDLYRMNFVQIEHALTKAIEKELTCLDRDLNILSKLIVSAIPTEFQKEEISFYKTFKDVNKYSDTEISQLLAKHHSEYAYMHSAYGEKPYSLEFYKGKLGSTQNINKIIKDIKNNSTESKKLLKTLKSEKLNTLVPLMIEGGEFRDSNKARLGHSMKYKFAVLDEISKRFQINRNHVSYYGMRDLLLLLRKNKKLSDSVIKSREEKGVVLVRTEGLIDIGNFQSFTADQLIDICSNGDKKTSEQLILRGVSASPGCVKGKAKIVFSSEDGDKVNSGDIMVAIGTDFDLMDAIQKSGAVITEEGGLLSHASVVCRELEKPCCIAVEDATVIIKDGDMLEVDATSGKISIQNEK